MVNMDVMYDDMRHILQSYTPISSDMNAGATAINSLVRIENELVFEFDDHVGWEDDPKGFVLYDSMAKSAWFGVSRVVVGGISDGVDPATFAT